MTWLPKAVCFFVMNIMVIALCPDSLATSLVSSQPVMTTSGNNQLQCYNCGGSGKNVVVKGAGDVRQYQFLIDTPYYTFLASKNDAACPYTSWSVINKRQSAPRAGRFDVGCYPVKDFRAVYDRQTTRFIVEFLSGVTEIIEFYNE